MELQHPEVSLEFLQSLVFSKFTSLSALGTNVVSNGANPIETFMKLSLVSN